MPELSQEDLALVEQVVARQTPEELARALEDSGLPTGGALPLFKQLSVWPDLPEVARRLMCLAGNKQEQAMRLVAWHKEAGPAEPTLAEGEEDADDDALLQSMMDGDNFDEPDDAGGEVVPPTSAISEPGKFSEHFRHLCNMQLEAPCKGKPEFVKDWVPGPSWRLSPWRSSSWWQYQMIQSCGSGR